MHASVRSVPTKILIRVMFNRDCGRRVFVSSPDRLASGPVRTGHAGREALDLTGGGDRFSVDLADRGRKLLPDGDCGDAHHRTEQGVFDDVLAGFVLEHAANPPARPTDVAEPAASGDSSRAGVHIAPS